MTLASQIREMAPGLKLEWLDDAQIVYYQFTDSSRHTLDTWLAVVPQVLDDFSPEEPYLSVYDLRSVGLTPYMRECAECAQHYVAARAGATAVILPNTASGHVLRFFIHMTMRSEELRRQTSFFHRRDAALEWVRTFI